MDIAASGSYCSVPRRHIWAADVLAFVTWLARGGGAACSTQGQALSALAFLYREMLVRP